MINIQPIILYQIIETYTTNIQKELVDRWNLTYSTDNTQYLYEVIIGLLSRQISLSIYFAHSPRIWNDDIGTIILRSVVENIINIKWILHNDSDNRAKLFVDYGLSQEKLKIEHTKAQLDLLEGSDRDNLNEVIEMSEKRLNQEKFTFLTDVNLGSWCEKSIRTIAVEAGLKDFYNQYFVPFSNSAHGTWNHIISYALKRSPNPLQQLRRRPIFRDLDPDINYIELIGRFMSYSFEAFDEFYNLTAPSIDSFKILIKDINDALDEKQ